MAQTAKLQITGEPQEFLDSVSFHHRSYCKQNEILVGTGRFRSRNFYAVFACIKHPKHGVALIDTGYGPMFFRATTGFPERAFRWLLPVASMPNVSAETRWMEHGFQVNEIETVFVSHFHADHVGALFDFADAEIVYRSQSLHDLNKLSRFNQVRSGFLSKLVPEDIGKHAALIAENDFQTTSYRESCGTESVLPFRAIDWWGDGSFLLIDMPGHSTGHTGYLMRTRERSILYVVDACWDVEVLMNGNRLPAITVKAQHDGEAYLKTQSQIRELAKRTAWEIVACHCPLTQLRADHSATIKS